MPGNRRLLLQQRHVRKNEKWLHSDLNLKIQLNFKLFNVSFLRNGKQMASPLSFNSFLIVKKVSVVKCSSPNSENGLLQPSLNKNSSFQRTAWESPQPPQKHLVLDLLGWDFPHPCSANHTDLCRRDCLSREPHTEWRALSVQMAWPSETLLELINSHKWLVYQSLQNY